MQVIKGLLAQGSGFRNAGAAAPELFERYQRSEKALVDTLVEMYVQSVSARKVKAVPDDYGP